MTIESAAATLAEQLRRQEFVSVIAHHDADGIAAGSILCHAMSRAGIRFRFRIRHTVTKSDLSNESANLLCDIGAGMETLPPEAMVIDHHVPVFKGELHVNPHLAGIDGDTELSSAGAAYLVAQELGDNRDLAGLVICGILGDSQEIRGKNLEICNEAIANGIVSPGRGVTLPGRDMPERWYTAISPYLEGISGNQDRVADLIETSVDEKEGSESGTELDLLLSRIILTAAPAASWSNLQKIYGDTYALQREVIEDGHSLTAVIDACGKTGHGDIGATLCLRSSQHLKQAWEIARLHRTTVIAAVQASRPADNMSGIYQVPDATVASDVADILVRDSDSAQAILVYARSGDACRISARITAGKSPELGPLVRQLAATHGGEGGGHVLRAGATIPCGNFTAFARDWKEATAS